MRIAVVSLDTYQSRESPRTRRLDRVAKQLNAAGNEVIVCCNQWWGGSPETFEQDGITYRRVTKDRSVRRFGTRLPLILRKIDPDIVHAAYWPPGAAAGAGAGRWIARTPVFLDWFGDKSVEPTKRTVRSAISLASVIGTPSRHVQTQVRELGAESEQTRIIPESIDIQLVKNQRPAAGPDIVTARHLDDEANIDMMLLGLAELRDRDWEAMVIGDGPQRRRYEEKAAELRIADRVTFTGNLSREERVAHYKAAHVFIQTAERCPFATELLWALASGCVGIVDYQENSAAHELVEAFDRGFRTTSSEALSEAILEASELEELSYDAEFEHYHHSRVLNRYFEAYDDILS